jgi:Chaperone of endosialidase
VPPEADSLAAFPSFPEGSCSNIFRFTSLALLCVAACSLAHAAAAQTNALSSSATNTVGLWANGTEYLHISSTGNVGIGTTAPNTTLQVNGSIMMSTGTCGSSTAGSIQWNGSALQYCNGSSWTTLAAGIGGSGTTNYLARWTPNGTTLGIGATYDNGADVGIGTTGPAELLDVDGGLVSVRASGAVPSSFSVGGLYMGFYGGGTESYIQSSGASTTNDYLVLNPNGGNVGIGTATFRNSSADLLAVYGTAAADWIEVDTNSTGHDAAHASYDGTNLVASGLLNGETCGAGNWAVYAGGCRMEIMQSGNVGIGSTAPSANLHIYGAASPNGLQMELQNSGATAGHYRVVGADSANNFSIYNQSAVGVYLTDGGTSWTAGSDVRLKKNIETLTVLDRLNGYRAVSFDWKANGNHDVGVIAQELYKAFPEVVDKGSDSGTVTNMSDPGVWGVRYDKLGALALEGLKELKSLLDGDRDEIAKLKADNDDLRTIIAHEEDEIADLRREVRAQ